jgi:hypothetical protein
MLGGAQSHSGYTAVKRLKHPLCMTLTSTAWYIRAKLPNHVTIYNFYPKIFRDGLYLTKHKEKCNVVRTESSFRITNMYPHSVNIKVNEMRKAAKDTCGNFRRCLTTLYQMSLLPRSCIWNMGLYSPSHTYGRQCLNPTAVSSGLSIRYPAKVAMCRQVYVSLWRCVLLQENVLPA